MAATTDLGLLLRFLQIFDAQTIINAGRSTRDDDWERAIQAQPRLSRDLTEAKPAVKLTSDRGHLNPSKRPRVDRTGPREIYFSDKPDHAAEKVW
jgi:hypothetical protein